jgi:outer membrane protein assembly factor BamB
MARRLKYLIRFFFLVLLMIVIQTAGSVFSTATGFTEKISHHYAELIEAEELPDSVTVLVGTFLGNEKRNFYGDSAPDRLDVVWKLFLGHGTTIVNAERGEEEWYGAGWTGQPLIVKEKNKTYLLQGAFDHHLKKIDAESGALVWEYEYDDIIKGTGTIWVNDSAADPANRILVLQGSRKGVHNSLHASKAESYRAVSYFTGKEIWRMNIEHTASYSRDVDASALILDDTAYLGLENGKFISFDPGRSIITADTFFNPRIFGQHMLYTNEDAARHGGNLVTESSPVKIGDHIYIAAGSGHVYGYNLLTDKLDWDFYIGSDMDGTPVATADNCLLVTVEKQYITGKGGVFKLNPAKPENSCVEWYYPTGDFDFSSWKGGVIGSVSVNDHYNTDGMYPHMAAFTGIDGYLTVVHYDRLRSDTTVAGPDGKTQYKTPVVIFKKRTGPSISTPLFVQQRLIAAGYGGIHIFSYNHAGIFISEAFHPGIFETTPVANAGKIYAASRDGYLYCFGDTSNGRYQKPVATVTMALSIPKISNEAGATVSSGSEEHFYLIAGAFRIRSNAQASVDAWRKKGVNASVMLSPAGLYYVTLASATTQEDIASKHLDLQQKHNVDAWVYRK